MKRIVIAGFQHETNRFGATKARFADFEMADSWPGILYGHAAIDGLRGSTLPLWGFARAAEQEAELCPILWCSAEPSSYVTDEAYDQITGMILEGVASAGAIDGIYLDLHGAMVTESHFDGEGELLRRLRQRVGLELPIAISLDNHANITQAMVQQASAITSFRSYPHLDMDTSGERCWPIMRALLEGQRPCAAFRQAPFLLPLQAQYTGAEPLASIYAKVASLGQEPMAWAELALGFPAADIPDAGPSILAYAPTQKDADYMAEALLAALTAAEAKFDGTMLPPAEAVQQAMLAAQGSGSVVLADVQDNPGAGASSDSIGLLAALVEEGARDAALGMLNDPETASLAHRSGIGEQFQAQLGSKEGQLAPPFTCQVEVEALSDGHFDFTGEMYRGSTADTGLSALLRICDGSGSVRVAVSSKRCQCLDQAVFTHLGLNPADQRILAVKSTVHFRADFAPLAQRIINVSSPGLNPCTLEDIPFQHLRAGVRLGPLGPDFPGG